MTPAQRALFDLYWTACQGWTADQWARWLHRRYGVRKVAHLTDAQATEALPALRAHLAARQRGASE